MQYRKKQRFYFILMIIDLSFFVGLAVSLAFLPWSSDLKLVLLVIITGLLALSVTFINSYVKYYQIKYQFFMLRDNAEKPLKTKVDLLSKSFLQKRKLAGFSEAKAYGDYYITYKYTFDRTSRFYRQGALEVIVLILNNSIPFDAPQIIESINRIEDDFIYKKQTISKYYIYTVKETKELSIDQMSEANMVQFEQQKMKHITSINLLFNKESNEVYFLHSKSFSPNAYYEFAVSEIKSWL